MRISLIVRPGRVAVELFTVTVAAQAGGSSTGDQQQPRRLCETRDGRAAHWRGEIVEPTDEQRRRLRARLRDPSLCLRYAIRERKANGSAGKLRLLWLCAVAHPTCLRQQEMCDAIGIPEASYEAGYWVTANLQHYDEVVEDVMYLRTERSDEREADAPPALHIAVPPEREAMRRDLYSYLYRDLYSGIGFTGVYWLRRGQPVNGRPSYRHAERSGPAPATPNAMPSLSVA